MPKDDILLLSGSEVASLLYGREIEIIRTVKLAYEAHWRNNSALPHSTFLRFPDDERNRIIALPAYLGESFAVAGVKWISSFPGNVGTGMDRASAIIVLNSVADGRPEVILEGSIISAKRTAASAALAAGLLSGEKVVTKLGLIGLGLINYEIARFILAALRAVTSFIVYDLDASRAGQFARKCRDEFGDIEVTIAPDVETVLRNSPMISLATTAVKPHIHDCSMCSPGTVLLHVSLRDLAPEVILSGDNIVDDIDHVCRAQTSVHLAEQLAGNRSFIRCALGDMLAGNEAGRRDDDRIVVFSPFGLGILDLAVSALARARARELGLGITIPSFFPYNWMNR